MSILEYRSFKNDGYEPSKNLSKQKLLKSFVSTQAKCQLFCQNAHKTINRFEFLNLKVMQRSDEVKNGQPLSKLFTLESCQSLLYLWKVSKVWYKRPYASSY